MVEIDITRLSSKGQIVIPLEMRKKFRKGEKLVIIQNDNQIILKKTNDFGKNIKEDLKFAKKTEEAWKRYNKGKMKEMNFDTFLEKIKKW